MTGAKILLADIETAPIVGNTWGLWDQTIGLNQIEQEWAILSFAAKPLGGSKRQTIYVDTFDKADKRDDFDLCTKLHALLDEYDFVIAQNGKRFDLRKIRARLIMHGFQPHSPVKVIDTLLMAKQVAAFTSNKLEWLSEHLTNTPKEKHKNFPGFELWREFLRGNPKARTAMRKYNIRDIDALEQVYLKLRPWVNDHPNVNVYHDDNAEVRCKVCSSPNVEKRGYAYTNVGQYHRYRCSDCGAWSRSRYTLNPIKARRNLTT